MMDFLAPGTGIFAICFLWMSFDFYQLVLQMLRGLNFASNIAGALFFHQLWHCRFVYAIPMGLAMMVGAFRARMAITKRYVKNFIYHHAHRINRKTSN